MIRKILFTLLVFPAFFCRSQLEYNHSLGSGILFFSKAGYFNFYPCIQYDARLTFVLHHEFSLSLAGSPAISLFGVGKNVSVSSFGVNKESLKYLPLYLQINAGHGASKKSLESEGGFAGLGFAYLGQFEDKDYFRPAFTFGVRTVKDFKETTFTIKCDIIPDINGKNGKQNMFNIGILYNFGLRD